MVDLVELLGLEALPVLADQVLLVHQLDHLEDHPEWVLLAQQDQRLQVDHRERVLLDLQILRLQVDHREKDLLDQGLQVDRLEKVPLDRLGLLDLLENYLLVQDLQVRVLLDLQGHLVDRQVKLLLDHQDLQDHLDLDVWREDLRGLQGLQGHLDLYVLILDHP